MAKLNGYNGQIAYVNLSDSKVEIKDLDPKIAESFVGGVGLSAKLTYDLLKDADYDALKKDPLAPVNPLIFATGPLTGTLTPSSSRYSVTGISPLTGIWGESTSGGYFPTALKRCGFDAVVITGEAKSPKMISIANGAIEIKDASPLWGKNTRDTIIEIRKQMNDDKLRIACIGKGGENLVKYAAVMNDEGRAAGRCGLGAIMGKKKLKALVVKGSSPIEYAEKEELMKFAKSSFAGVQNSFSSNFFSHYGTLCYTDMGMVIGDVPANYFTSTEFIAERLTGRYLKEQYPVLKYNCSGCMIGCGRTTIAKIDGKEVEIDGPEYETVAAYGPMCGVLDFDPVLKANHICNLEGIDTISSGVAVSFLIYLVENKIAVDKIKAKLTDIKLEEIKWGNAGVILKLLNKIIARADIGQVLAEGVKKMAQILGVDPELAAHVKGLEIPMHDPRAYFGQALSYMTSCCGASHEKGDFFNIDGDGAVLTGIKKGDRFEIKGREDSVVAMQDLADIYDSSVVCNFPHLQIPTIGRLLKSATGFGSLGNKKKMMMAGERATNVKRLISYKLGCKREDDKLPKLVTKVLESGGSLGVKLDLEESLKKYYDERSWDWTTGLPTKEKLEELEI